MVVPVTGCPKYPWAGEPQPSAVWMPLEASVPAAAGLASMGHSGRVWREWRHRAGALLSVAEMVVFGVIRMRRGDSSLKAGA